MKSKYVWFVPSNSGYTNSSKKMNVEIHVVIRFKILCNLGLTSVSMRRDGMQAFHYFCFEDKLSFSVYFLIRKEKNMFWLRVGLKKNWKWRKILERWIWTKLEGSKIEFVFYKEKEFELTNPILNYILLLLKVYCLDKMKFKSVQVRQIRLVLKNLTLF